ncbi:DNA-directed RNA polymerase subunit K [Methanosarcinaceae archaeon]|nr:DNA-directed RNA polymerase subunit K [Methanosarcinaceae archaeon]MBQ3620956.1 DNA-directed RNA polymerase subunit K [Methanosarcinaceae archaeon]
MQIQEYTRFERARIIGARALQISMGAPVLINSFEQSDDDPLFIALDEFNKGIIPVTVKRVSSSKSYSKT